MSIIYSIQLNEKERTIEWKGLKDILVSDISDINKMHNKLIPMDGFKRLLTLSRLLLTPDDNVLGFDSVGQIFFITLEEGAVTNIILIRPRNLANAIKTLYDLAMSPDGKKLAGGGIDHSMAKENYLYTWTLLTDENEKTLHNLSHHLLSNENITIDHLKLIYQLWLACQKGIEPFQYQMSATEKDIYQSMPESIKKLLN